MSEGTSNGGRRHPATLARPKVSHPAVASRPKPWFGAGTLRPAHAATIVQSKMAPHPATVGRGASSLARFGVAQRAEPAPQAEYVASSPVEGTEDDVRWIWVGNLDLRVSNGCSPVRVDPHRLHRAHVAAARQIFYGSYTIVHANGELKFGEVPDPWYPTKAEHTEPQYFAWLTDALAKEQELRQAQDDIVAVILEINQTNTPCSRADCRPTILGWVKSVKWGRAYCIARMSSAQLFQSSYPKVGLTSLDASKLRKGKKLPLLLHGPAAVHGVPELFNQF